MVKRILVGDNERVLLIRNKRFSEILEPGERWVFGFGLETERVSTRDLVFAGPWAEFIVKERPEVAARHFTVVETSDMQVAVVYIDRKLARVIGPGQSAIAGLFHWLP